MKSDALALEYKRDYGTAWSNLNVSHFINNPVASGKCRVFGLGLPEESLDRLGRDLCALKDDCPDPLLIREDTV